MVVVVVHDPDARLELAQVFHKGALVGNAGKAQDEVVARHPRQVVELHIGSGKHRHRVAVVHIGEKELGRREQSQFLLDELDVDRLNVVGALGHHHKVGLLHHAIHGLAQGAQGQESVVVGHAVVVAQHNVDFGLHIAVLESVVEQKQVDGRVDLQHFLDALAPALAHGQRDVAQKLVVYLIRLVAYVARCERVASHDKAVGQALVAAAEHAYVILRVVGQQALDDVFYMRRLARTAHSDVAHRHDGHVIARFLEDASVEGSIATPHARAIEPREWGEKGVGDVLSLLLVQYFGKIYHYRCRRNLTQNLFFYVCSKTISLRWAA